MIYYTDFDYDSLELPPICYDRRLKKYVCNIPLSFDVETSTIDFVENGETFKRSFMYIWQFGIDGTAVYGHTWEEFKEFLKMLGAAFKLNSKKWAIIYVHNLGFEFEFLHSIIEFTNVFARSTHHPIYADCPDYYIEFRDSLILSGLSLEKTAQNLAYHKIRKMVGDLDYSKIRLPGITEMTEEELKYCENDVLILNAYIAEEINYNSGKISNIPLTRTGYARRRFRNAMKKSPIWKKWKKRIAFTYPSKELFCLLNKAFAGGYTHANAQYCTLINDDVTSIDFSSSYPAQMIRHKYPLGEWIKIECNENLTKEHFEFLMTSKAVVCEVMFKDIEQITDHTIISRSKCCYFENAIFDNGRLVSADLARTFITDVDYKTLKLFYKWDKIKVFEMWVCDYEYLPTPFVQEILNLFGIKTELKGVDGKEDEYMRGKGDLNSAYGMSVTNPVDDLIKFDGGEWVIERQDMQKLLDENKKSYGYFLPYCIGVWVTAWARYELLSTVAKINHDCLYCDTDSIKMTNFAKYKNMIDEYNTKCAAEIRAALIHHNIDPEKAQPKTIKGVTKQLGVFEVDAHYQYFKTLGAKRYCYIDDNGEFHFTASGIPKGKPLKYILKLAEETGKDPLDLFCDGLQIPEEWSDKLTHYTFNDKHIVQVTDYQGNGALVSIGSCCVLVPQPYEMSMNKNFIAFLMGLQKQPLIGKSQPMLNETRPELKIRSYD